KRGRAVTLLAGRAAVRSPESEPRLGMIEARHLAPRPHVVAHLARLLDRRQKAYVCPTHPGLVRILVTAGATAIGNLVGHCVVEFRPLLVAIAAGDGDVTAFQREARLVVARQRELRRLEAVHRVAAFAAVLVWRVRKLAGVYVTVAVYAFLVPNLIASRRARWLVALIASYRGMLAEQWIQAFRVRQHRVSGRLPAIGGMATGAVARVGACGKLPPMDVLVAGLTLLMRHRGLVVGGLVALVAGHRRVLAQQREFRLGMVERRERISRRLPREIVMTRIAARGERTAVRILVTIGALRKRDSGVADRLCVGIGRRQRAMALGAIHLGMRARQLVFGRVMVESRDIFPFGDRVAARAFVAHLPLVPVLVARRAGCAQSQVGAAQVLHEDHLAGRRRNPLGIVAARALEPRMTAFQRIARLAMIEVIQADIPADRDELLAVMLGMALRALVVAPRLAHPHLIHQSRVQTLVRREPLLDLRVTTGALQLAIAAAANVTTGAVRGPVELRVRFGECAGRELGQGQRREN